MVQLLFFSLLTLIVQIAQASSWKILSNPNDVLKLTSEGTWGKLKFGQQNEIFYGLRISKGESKFETSEFQVSTFDLAEITYKDYEFKMSEGALRIIFPDGKSKRRWVVKSELAAAYLKGSDFILHYDRSTASFKVIVLKGDAILRGEGREEESLVREGEIGQFEGVAELDGPAFDTMIKGKMVVRGGLVESKKISLVESESFENQYRIDDYVPPKPKMVKAKPGEICKAPFAQFNQCAWFCDGNPKKEEVCRLDLSQVSCIRKKCNANAEWKEEFRVPASKAPFACQSSSPQVGPCDY